MTLVYQRGADHFKEIDQSGAHEGKALPHPGMGGEVTSGRNWRTLRGWRFHDALVAHDEQ
jgi:hypothetical protein